jgi:hypothetical protein
LAAAVTQSGTNVIVCQAGQPLDFAMAWDDGFEIGNEALEDIILEHAAKD